MSPEDSRVNRTQEGGHPQGKERGLAGNILADIMILGFQPREL